MKHTLHYSSKVTPATSPIPGRIMVPNSAGGYTFQIDSWDRLERFLILGTEGGTYYASERKLTRENAAIVEKLLVQDGRRVVDVVVSVSETGRAPKNDTAIFVLAMAAKLGCKVTRAYAMACMPRVCRTGTHLFQFSECVQALGGWGRGTRDGISAWYNDKDPDDLAYQLVKYQQRDGWSHRDLLRLAHPMPATNIHEELFRYVLKKDKIRYEQLPAIVEAVEEAKTASTARLMVLIHEHNLPREVIPTEKLKEVVIWGALLDRMPITALIRNLATMTRIGLLAPMHVETDMVAERLTNPELLKKGRVHPIQLLSALLTYKGGHSQRGESFWNPVPRIVDALDEGFYAAFGAVEPSHARTLLALDVSGSMSMGTIAGVPGLTPRLGAAAMALVTANVEKKYGFVVFSHNLTVIDISPKMRLDAVARMMETIPFGATNPSLPMLAAAQEGWQVDAFCLYTDNELNYGTVHPSQALRLYRQRTGIEAKSAVVAMTSTGFSIADPNDGGMMDVVGFDTATPQLISDFSRPKKNVDSPIAQA